MKKEEMDAVFEREARRSVVASNVSLPRLHH